MGYGGALEPRNRAPQGRLGEEKVRQEQNFREEKPERTWSSASCRAARRTETERARERTDFVL
jgi:hypothetical protein